MLFSDCNRNSLHDTDRSVFLSGGIGRAVVPITADTESPLMNCGRLEFTFGIMAKT